MDPKSESELLFEFDNVEAYLVSDYHLPEIIKKYADTFRTGYPLAEVEAKMGLTYEQMYQYAKESILDTKKHRRGIEIVEKGNYKKLVAYY